MNSLALSLQPAPFETPTAFASRLAARNGVENVTTFCLELGLDLRAIANGDTCAVTELCSIAGLAPDALASATERCFSKTRYQVCSENFDRQTLKRTNIRVCPECLREQHRHSTDIWDKIHMFIWKIPQVMCCPLHDERLIEIVEPTHGLERFDTTQAIQSAWTRIKSEHNRESANRFEKYLYSRLYKGRGTALCDRLSIVALERIATALGVTLQYGKAMRRATLQPNEQHEAFLFGFDLIHAGEGAVVDALKKFSSRMADMRGFQPGPQYGELQRLIGQKIALNEEFEPFRDVMRRYVMGHYPLEAGRTVFGYKVPERRIHCLRSARAELGLSPQAFEALMLENNLMREAADGSAQITQPLTVDVIKSLKPRKKRYLTGKETEQFLGASETVFKEISKSGILNPIKGNNRLGPKGYDAKQLQTIVDTFFARTERFDHAPDGIYTLASITRIAKCSTPDILKLMLDGKLKAAGRLGHEKTLNALLISKTDLVSALPRPPRNAFSKSELIKRWRIGPDHLKQIIKSGWLREKRMKCNRSRVTNILVPAKDVDAFERTFIVLLIILNRPR